MTTTNPITAEHLRSFIERLERLYEDRESIGTDIKDVFAEAKASGFDVPTMRQIIKLRKMEAAERDEAEHMIDLYLMALGMSSSPSEPEGD